LVNRIQNRRKEMDLQITDRIEIYLSGLGAFADLQAAVEVHKGYILEETQGVGIFMDGGEGVAGNACTTVEGCEVGLALVAG